MSAFSYQQPQIILPNSSREMSNACSCCLYVNSSNDLPQDSAAEAKVSGSRSSLETARIFLSGDTQYASMVVDPNSSVKVPQPDGPVEKTRKNIDITCLSSDLPQEIKVPKKSNGRRQKKAAEGKKNKSDKKREEAKMSREHPTGYIHVRARRGQATDSHSLAERVRREKISQRMKLLQGLVPGCEKITGKALLLDAIINYVRTLQHHVEFLSMKLALVNPALLHDLDKEVISGHVDQQQITGSMSQASLSVQSVHQTYPIQQAAFDETTANYPMMDNSAHRLLHGQGTIALPQINDTYLLMQVADQGLELLNQVVLNNVSFQ